MKNKTRKKMTIALAIFMALAMIISFIPAIFQR
jgi:thiamine transporter ThiT